ncbi:MAG: hypothetical protein CM15mP6_3220 [Methanobacteriota archaeon]|nr:MAG: hypothetical protein CM15mP6_3220 [Euryarchaeota archaeon]
MSLPRRAMEQMGFSVCCLMCDAPDVAGSRDARHASGVTPEQETDLLLARLGQRHKD